MLQIPRAHRWIVFHSIALFTLGQCVIKGKSLCVSLNRSSGSCLLRFYQLHWQHFCIISSFFLFVLTWCGTWFVQVPSGLFPACCSRAAATGVRPPTSVHKEPNLNPLSCFRDPTLSPPLNRDTNHFIHLTRFILNSSKCLYLIIWIVSILVCASTLWFFFFCCTVWCDTKKRVAKCQTLWKSLEVNGSLKYSTCNVDVQDRCAFKTKYIHKWSL